MGLPDNRLPDEKLPACWSDDVRMNALFAPFRLKSANPESWEMKMKFWSDMLRQWCRHKMDPVVSASDLKFVFQRKGRSPACLDIVVEELFRNGELCPISKYQQILHNGPEGWVRWGARLAFKPAVFALTAVSSLLPARQAIDGDGLPKASIDSTQRFIVENVVKEQAMELLNKYPPDNERIGTIEELMRNCHWEGGRETFEILLGYLVSQGFAVKKDDVVKLAEPNKKVTAVTESDEALVKLISAETRLEADLARLQREETTAGVEARAALQLGNKLAAKNHLRRKHKAQQRVLRCESTLDNVRQLLQQMRDTTVNATIVDTYRTSSEAMKKGMKEGGLEEDAVHDTMDDLKEVMDNYNEVEKALGTTIDDFDAAELEQELKDLLSGPGAPGGGTPHKDERIETRLPSPPSEKPIRKVLDREFIFDGEERMIAELNELSVEDPNPKDGRRKKLAVAEGVEDTTPEPKKTEPREKPSEDKPKASKAWYPPTSECLRPETWTNNNLDAALQNLSEGYAEVRQDERLHPGQKLNVDFTTPPKLYNTDFQVRDHKMAERVWLYNRDANSNIDDDLAQSTEYFSSESPGKSGGSFQMAPGGERKKLQPWPQDEESKVEDLERRLKNLRGFNL